MNKKNILIIISIFTFIIIAGGVSYSYFVYNKNVGDISLNAGEIAINLSNTNDKTLSNVIPMSDYDGKNISDYFDFTVNSTVDTERIYYEVYILPDVNNTLDTSYLKTYLTDQSNNEIKSVSYYNNLSNSEKENGKVIYKGIVELNNNETTKNEAKDFRLRMWLDENYINSNSDTFDFDIYLYAKNVDRDFELPTAFNIIKKNVITGTLINFVKPSSNTNGKGLYRLLGTENDNYPIYYYRGDLDNNNVVFGGFCWQIVRTTDTGGIKMIYNGLPDVTGSGDNITYNCGTTRDIQDTIRTTTSLQDSKGYFYADDYEIVSTTGNSVTYRLKSKTNPITQVAIQDASGASTNIPTIATSYPYTCKGTTETATCTTLYKVDSYASYTNANVYSSLDRTIIGRIAFNTQESSVSDVGYMSNTRYPYSSSGWTTNALFASNATWVTDHYELVDAAVTSPDTTHHYSCNQAGASATCTSLRYVYYVSGTTKYYITLTGGDTIEDALYKMTGNGSAETKTKNAGYNLNVNNSTAKETIDNWFRTNLTSEVDTNNPDYSVYLEDAVYCNDRSYKETGSSNTYTQSGWNPQGGSLSTNLYFGMNNRFGNSWYSTSNVPNMTCPNETDRFTVSNANGNGALTYPVGLLTADEIIMAGVGGNNESASNYSYYLYTNDYYWFLAPYLFSYRSYGSLCSSNLSNTSVGYSNYGLRPSVSLRPGTEFLDGGDGTATNPYVVKMG